MMRGEMLEGGRRMHSKVGGGAYIESKRYLTTGAMLAELLVRRSASKPRAHRYASMSVEKSKSTSCSDQSGPQRRRSAHRHAPLLRKTWTIEMSEISASAT